jgi:hypothetical protein
MAPAMEGVRFSATRAFTPEELTAFQSQTSEKDYLKRG